MRRHVVLDLDSTLVHSSPNVDEYSKLDLRSLVGKDRDRVYRYDLIDVNGSPGEGILYPMWSILRPYVREFIEYLLDNYTVHVWSAGKYKYVHQIVDALFPDPYRRPVTILTYDDCEFIGDYIFKPLKRIYELNPEANPSNTIIIDDRTDTFSRDPDNGIHIPIYEPPPTIEGIMREDYALLKIMLWLSTPMVKETADIRYLDKRYIFAYPISDYLEVINP